MLKNNKKEPAICEDDFTGKFVVITGATSGIGYQTAKEYAVNGANLLFLNRNEEKSKKLCKEIQKKYGVECNYIIVNYEHLSEVKKAAQTLLNMNQTIDVFIHNAGVYLEKKELTDDGNEKVFQVNFLASFLINYLLKEKFIDQNHGRIIFVNSEGHRFSITGLKIDDLNWHRRRFTGLKGYGAAKTAQLLSLLIYKEYFKGTNVTINAMHPGNVLTPMGEIEKNGKLYLYIKRNFINRFAKHPSISAKALYYLGVSQNLKDVTGKFFNLTTEEEPGPSVLDGKMAVKLWKKSIKLVGLE